MEHALHESIPLYASSPFFVMLMMIAVGPLFFTIDGNNWSSNAYNQTGN